MRFLIGFMAVLLAGCVTASPPQVPPGSWVAIDADFPDPAVIRAEDGYYYAYATQGRVDGLMRNMQIARSRDLRSWEHRGDALAAKPGWGEPDSGLLGPARCAPRANAMRCTIPPNRTPP